VSKINQNGNAPMNTLKPQPGQSNSYDPTFHPLPGDWARKQLEKDEYRDPQHISAKEARHDSTQLQKALAAERAQHEYWEEWQGVRPGKAVYENPREMQNTLLPTAKYGTEGRGYG
jgi:hypothetical protein